MSMNVNGAGKDLSVELALTNLGTAGAGKSAVEIKDTALGPVISGNGVTVVLPSDLQEMLAKMGLERDDQRRDLLAMKLSSALSMMLGSMQLFNAQQQAALEGIAACEKELERIEGGVLLDDGKLNGGVDTDALAALGIALDPEIVAIQLEIQKLDQMIESMKQTPEDKRTEEEKQKLAKDEQDKADQEKALQEKTDKLIDAIKSVESNLFKQLSTDCVSALFSALATVAALARKELAENSDVTDLTKMLDGAEQLAIALGAERPDELAEFNAMMEQLNANRVTMA